MSRFPRNTPTHWPSSPSTPSPASTPHSLLDGLQGRCTHQSHNFRDYHSCKHTIQLPDSFCTTASRLRGEFFIHGNSVELVEGDCPDCVAKKLAEERGEEEEQGSVMEEGSSVDTGSVGGSIRGKKEGSQRSGFTRLIAGSGGRRTVSAPVNAASGGTVDGRRVVSAPTGAGSSVGGSSSGLAGQVVSSPAPSARSRRRDNGDDALSRLSGF